MGRGPESGSDVDSAGREICGETHKSIPVPLFRSRSDVDLVVIGDAGPRDVSAMLSDAGEKIGREVNPIVLSKAEFAKRLKNQDHFIGRIMEGPKLYILGGENDLAAMGR